MTMTFIMIQPIRVQLPCLCNTKIIGSFIIECFLPFKRPTFTLETNNHEDVYGSPS